MTAMNCGLTSDRRTATAPTAPTATATTMAADLKPRFFFFLFFYSLLMIFFLLDYSAEQKRKSR